MFEQMKAMGAIAGLMKNKDKLRQVGDDFRARLAELRVTGVAGGSLVRVTITGQLEVTEVFIDPTTISGAAQDGENGQRMLSQLVQEATNDAIKRMQALISEEARKLAAELDLPPMPGLEKMLTGGA
jgi:DNA-binding YbaB/EbfC family protein